MTFRRCSALAVAALLALAACDSAEVGEIEAVQAVDTLQVPMGPAPVAFRIGPYFRQTNGRRLTFEVESSSPTVSATTTNDTLWVEPVSLGMGEVRLRVSNAAGHHLVATIPVRIVPPLNPCFPEPGMEQRDYFPIRLGHRWIYDYHKSSRDWGSGGWHPFYDERGDLTLEVVGVDCSSSDEAVYQLARAWTGSRRSWYPDDPEGEITEPVNGSGMWTLTESEEGMLTLAHYDDPFPRYFEASAEAMQHFQIHFGHAGVGNLTWTSIDLERGVGLNRFAHSSSSGEYDYTMRMELREAVLE